MSIYESITTTITDAIAKGVQGSEWRMPWHRASTRPMNVATGNAYQGVNTLALWCESQARGFGSDVWGTLRQWNSVGAKVQRGARSSTVVFWKPLERGQKAEGGEEEEAGRRFVLRASCVFNASQVEGWEAPALPTDPKAAPEVEAAIQAAGVSVSWGGGRAFYDRRADRVQMPDRAAFFEEAGLASVLLHEAAHWTGHPTRLAREFGQRFGDQAYAFEELVAELAAAFLCAVFSVSNEPRPDHAQYVASWLEVLGRDQRAIFNAAKLASEAAQFFTRPKVEAIAA